MNNEEFPCHPDVLKWKGCGGFKDRGEKGKGKGKGKGKRSDGKTNHRIPLENRSSPQIVHLPLTQGLMPMHGHVVILWNDETSIYSQMGLDQQT